MSDLQFADPDFVHVLWAVAALLALLFWLDGRGDRLLGRFVAEPMQSRVVQRTANWRRRARLVAMGVCLTAIVVALMRPQWGFEFIQSRAVGAEIMIALDVSRSMLAEDVAPNRLERAKAEIRDLLPYLEGDQVGLIAFAGRASVLCPLTPDFGFLRLVLDRVDPRSVSRGGTRLEEPIRKATAGFGPSGDFARVILLITDGEDHDSFPVEAAREAAERGIRILAIGFGDEAGSQIVVTDPVTGARGRVSDADGRPVISRLDGDLLRELAVVSEGAYVPAGTGVLDLESIFEAHIRPLMRAEGSESGRTIHKDGFQWALLVAWIALIAAALLGGGGTTWLVVVLVVGAGIAPPPAAAQATDALGADGMRTTGQAGDDVDRVMSADPLGGGEAPAPRLDIPDDPRSAFNTGLAALDAGALEDAERLFSAARRTARNDGETRYRATYDLGWLEVARADTLLESEPEQALAALERGADWFREAIALRPAADAPRRNLEIVLARALVLGDSLAQREAIPLEQRLDTLIDAQRAVGRGARVLVEILQASDDPNASDALRDRFKSLAVEERKLLAEAGDLGELAGDEQETLDALPEAERTPENAMRIAQLEGLRGHLHPARERMGQARSQLRRRRAALAHRRSAAAVEHLKRAREQLQDPVRVMDGLITDASELSVETRALATAEVGLAIGPSGERVAAPEWLDASYLGDVQSSISQRTSELDQRFAGALTQAARVDDPDQRVLLEKVAAAAPRLSDAHLRFVEAGDALARSDVLGGVDAQIEAIEALVLAREQLLDLRGLIEVAHTDQQRIGAVLAAPTDEPDARGGGGDADPSAPPLAQLAPALAALQQRNLERAIRLDGLVVEAQGELEASAQASPANDDAATDEQRDAERQRLEIAVGLLALTESAMRGALDSLDRLGRDAQATEESRSRVGTASKGLESLRRLFFTIVEHLRDTLRRQVAINDATEAAAGRPAEERPAAIGPIAPKQASLADEAERIAEALHAQALTDPAELVGPEAAQDPAVAEQAAERLTRAAELVLEGSEAMGRSGEAMSGPEADLGAVRDRQDKAAERLGEALALLEPPQPDQQQQDPQQQQQDEEQQSEAQQPSPSEQASEQPDGGPEPNADPGQLLQAVRDREAERHRERSAGSSQYEPVDRDW